MSLATPLTHLVELDAAEAALRKHLGACGDDWGREPSALPEWTRAHVVAHLAGSAWGLVNLVRWSTTGVEEPMYASSDMRADDIERRAKLSWPDLLGEVSASAQALRQALGGLSEPVAARNLRLGSGAPVLVCDLAAVRIREIQVHRVDLADGYRAEHWPVPFTTRTLDQLVPFFRKRREVPVQILRSTDTGTCWGVGSAGPDLIGAASDLLGWLVGRPHGPLTTSDSSTPPVAPGWV